MNFLVMLLYTFENVLGAYILIQKNYSFGCYEQVWKWYSFFPSIFLNTKNQ